MPGGTKFLQSSGLEVPVFSSHAFLLYQGQVTCRTNRLISFRGLLWKGNNARTSTKPNLWNFIALGPAVISWSSVLVQGRMCVEFSEFSYSLVDASHSPFVASQRHLLSSFVLSSSVVTFLPSVLPSRLRRCHLKCTKTSTLVYLTQLLKLNVLLSTDDTTSTHPHLQNVTISRQ